MRLSRYMFLRLSEPNQYFKGNDRFKFRSFQAPYGQIGRTGTNSRVCAANGNLSLALQRHFSLAPTAELF
jgi:hypothetical protein